MTKKKDESYITEWIVQLRADLDKAYKRAHDAEANLARLVGRPVDHRGPFAVVVKRFDEHEVWEKEDRVAPEFGGVDAVVEWSEDWPKKLATFTDSGDAIAYAATRGQRIRWNTDEGKWVRRPSGEGIEERPELDRRRGPSACG